MMTKKLTSLLLALVMCFTLCIPSFAVSRENGERIASDKVITNKEVVYVDDGQGNIVAVTIMENINVSDGRLTGLKSSASDPYLGQRRSYTIQISNEMLGMPSLVGGALSLAAKKKAAQVAANAIAAKLGANFIPGLNVASWILSAAAMANAISGKAGIAITVELEYAETYWHREDRYTRGWSTVGLSVSRY